MIKNIEQPSIEQRSNVRQTLSSCHPSKNGRASDNVLHALVFVIQASCFLLAVVLMGVILIPLAMIFSLVEKKKS